MEKEKEKMSYDLIYQVYQKERQGAALTKVEKDFYEHVATLIKGLSDDYDAESKNNPSSTKCMLLYDELKKIRTLFREIYEYRIRKIALMALTGASEGSVDTRNLVGIETTIFDHLMTILKKSYDDVGRVEQGCQIPMGAYPSQKAPEPEATMQPLASPMKHPSAATDATGKAVAGADKATEVVSVENCQKEAAKPAAEPALMKKKWVAVQILEDIPKFAGEGGEVYILKKKDYASLPLTMAERLEKMGKARIMPT